jgi:hypothetical protein
LFTPPREIRWRIREAALAGAATRGSHRDGRFVARDRHCDEVFRRGLVHPAHERDRRRIAGLPEIETDEIARRGHTRAQARRLEEAFAAAVGVACGDGEREDEVRRAGRCAR